MFSLFILHSVDIKTFCVKIDFLYRNFSVSSNLWEALCISYFHVQEATYQQRKVISSRVRIGSKTTCMSGYCKFLKSKFLRGFWKTIFYICCKRPNIFCNFLIVFIALKVNGIVLLHKFQMLQDTTLAAIKQISLNSRVWRVLWCLCILLNN